MTEIKKLPSYAVAQSVCTAALPSQQVYAAEHPLFVSSTDQDLKAAMVAAGLDAIDPEEIDPALRDLVLRYARLLKAISADETLRGRRADVRGYVEWAQAYGLAPSPSQVAVCARKSRINSCRSAPRTRPASAGSAVRSRFWRSGSASKRWARPSGAGWRSEPAAGRPAQVAAPRHGAR